ncbi:YigZ family protein [Enterococcus olivae]
MIDTYLTIKEDGQAEIEIKKSRFICFFKRITSEEEAKAFIQVIKKEHWKANHNCNAFVLGDKNEIQRSSDDGEPSGTAGVPMLEVLKKNDLRNVVAVVTRYFGGTKLGAGGLIRAYSSAVSHALNEIGIVEGKRQKEIFVTIEYPLLGKLQHYLEQNNFFVKDTQFLEKITLCVMVQEEATFKEAVTDLLNGQVVFEDGEYSYVEQLIESKEAAT